MLKFDSPLFNLRSALEILLFMAATFVIGYLVYVLHPFSTVLLVVVGFIVLFLILAFLAILSIIKSSHFPF